MNRNFLFIALLMSLLFVYSESKSRVKRRSIDERVVLKIIVEQLGVNESEVHLESNLKDDLGADELDTTELIMALEEEFDIDIPDDEVEKLTTPKAIIEYINNHAH